MPSVGTPTTAFGHNSSTASTAVPSGLSPGDEVYLIVSTDGSSGSSIATPSGFEVLANDFIGGDGQRYWVGWKRQGSTVDSGSYSQAVGSRTDWATVAVPVSGRHATDPPVLSLLHSSTTNSTTVTANGVTAEDGDVLLFISIPDAPNSTSITHSNWASPFVEIADNATSWAQVGVAAVDSATAGATGTKTVTLSGSAAHAAWIIRIPTAEVVGPIEELPSWTEFHRIATAATPDFSDIHTTASRFDTIITSYTQRSAVASLHAAKSGLKALLYQEGPYTRNLANAANGYTSDAHSGVSEEQAAANNWYARDANGALITNQIIQSPDNLIDVGLSAVRSAWSTNSRARSLSAGGDSDFQGVFADDVNFDLSTSATAYPAAYPDNDTWWAALQGMFQAIYPDFSGASLELVPNMSQWMLWSYAVDAMNNILPFTTGGHNEFFTVFGSGSYSGWYHNDIALADNCINVAGKKFYATAHGTTTTALFAFCTLLLVAHPTDRTMQSFSYAGLQDYGNEYWVSDFELDIGSPVGTRSEIGGNATGHNAFQREFSKGWVCVNPMYNIDGSTRTGNVTFSLTGGTFTGSGFTSVTSVSLAPGTGAILANDSAPTSVPVSGTNDPFVLVEGASVITISSSRTETASVVEGSRTLAGALTRADVLAQSDVSSLAVTLFLAALDTHTLSDASAIASALVAADAMSFGDASAVKLSFSTRSDIASIVESSGIDAGLGASDFWTLADTSELLRTIQFSVSDTWTLTDLSSLFKLLSVSVSDDFAAVDESVSVVKQALLNASEVLTAAESAGVEASMSADEALALLETMALLMQSATADAAALIEGIGLSAALSSTDAVAQVETAPSEIATLLSSVADSHTQTEGSPATLVALLDKFDSAQVAELAAYSATLAALDSSVITDRVFASGQELSVSSNDSFSLSSELSSTLTQNVISVNDALTLADARSLAITLAAADSLTLGEIVAINAASAALDAGALAESLAMAATHSVSDSFSGLDLAEVLADVSRIDTWTTDSQSELIVSVVVTEASALSDSLDILADVLSAGDNLFTSEHAEFLLAKSAFDAWTVDALAVISHFAAQPPDLTLPTSVVVKFLAASVALRARAAGVSVEDYLAGLEVTPLSTSVEVEPVEASAELTSRLTEDTVI